MTAPCQGFDQKISTSKNIKIFMIYKENGKLNYKMQKSFFLVWHSYIQLCFCFDLQMTGVSMCECVYAITKKKLFTFMYFKTNTTTNYILTLKPTTNINISPGLMNMLYMLWLIMIFPRSAITLLFSRETIRLGGNILLKVRL